MTVKGRTESRWRFKRPPATHNLLIHFVHRADRFQYYDSAAYAAPADSATGTPISTGLKTEWFSSKAFLASLFGCAARPAVKCTNGAPACMDRPRTRIVRSKTAKRLDVVCSGQSRSRHDCPNRYPESHGPL